MRVSGRRIVALSVLGAFLIGAGVLVAVLLGGVDPAAPGPDTRAILPDAAPTQTADPVARPAPTEVAQAKVATEEFLDLAADRKEPAAETAGLAILRGRCVDAASTRSLAGCIVKFHGWPANTERLEDHVAKHGPVEWKDPAEITTSDDGLFSFSLIPPPPYQFMVDIRCAGRVTMHGRWISFDPGTTQDVGDVRMLPGTRVTGRVLDEDGLPQEKVSVSLSRQGGGSSIGDPKPRDDDSARSAADGSFAAREHLAPGIWRVEVRERETIEPDTILIEDGAPERFVEVKLRKRGAVESVSGVVVDDIERPVSGADIDYKPRHRGDTTWSISSKVDGSFRVERGPEDPAGPIRLSAERNGYEPAASTEPVTWGTSDLKLEMKRGLSVLLAVRISASQKLRRRFDLRSCTLKLQAIASDGSTPVEGVAFQVRLPEPSWPASAKKTGKDGRTEMKLLPIGLTVDLLVWPRELTTDEAIRAIYADGKRRPEDVMVVVARVALSAPETEERIVLPTSAGY